MVVLDSDHMSLLQRGTAEGLRIADRLRQLPPDDIATTIVSFEEQVRGWLARLSNGKSMARQIADYRELKKLLRNYCNITVIEFGAEAVAMYEQLQHARIRIGTMDLKIAAITLANSAVLLTRNAIDFARVPSLHYEDWSV